MDLLVHVIDPIDPDEMMPAAGFRIVLVNMMRSAASKWSTVPTCLPSKPTGLFAALRKAASGPISAAPTSRSPMYDLIRRARAGENNPWMRRRLELGPEQRDFLALEEFFAEGATDYYGQLFIFGDRGDPSQGTGVVYSFAVDRRGGFNDDDTSLLQATLPALSLAMKAHASYVIASTLLRTYLGEETGRRVHAGSVERGTVESIHAVLWYADVRGFTPMSDSLSGAAIIDLLNNVFETLNATLRARGGEVLKFLGDGMLATLSFEEANSRGDLPARARCCG